MMTGSNQSFSGNTQVRMVPVEADDRETTLKVENVKRLSRLDKIVKPYNVSFRLGPVAQQ